MKDAEGREVLVRLELPLPLSIVPELLLAICRTLEKAGYTDVSLLTDGTSRVVATPPAGRRGTR